MQSNFQAARQNPDNPLFHTKNISPTDRQLLMKTFLYVNKTYFNNEISAEVSWQVPDRTVSIAVSPHNNANKPNKPNKPNKDRLLQARITRHIAHGELQAACELIEPVAESGCSDAQLLLSHLFRKLHRTDWQYWTERYHLGTATRQMVPAACYYPDQQLICVHPYLCERRAPQWVLRYLIYHECCHQVTGCLDNASHPPAFMALELAAPNRERAIAWLRKEGFPAMDK